MDDQRSDTKGDRSPTIIELSWGRVVVEGYLRPFRDVKLYPGGAREWDWNETGTRHYPGIQPADLQELIEGDIETIVLSTGQNEQLGVSEDTLRFLENLEIRFLVLPTEEAVAQYNHLAETERVGALIHSTC